MVLAAGCASVPETNYFTLDMTPSRPAPELTTNVIVDRLRPSEALARPGIMIMKTPTQIEYYAADHWAANLGELVTQKLQAEFPATDPARPTVVVSGSILEFSQIDMPAGAEVSIRLELSMRPEGTSMYREPLLRKTYEHRASAPGMTAAAVVEALSQGLENVAAQLAADIARLRLDTAGDDA